jgi:4-amino-4-deoxy-L-arabinose transferase-like glycosyltransferase
MATNLQNKLGMALNSLYLICVVSFVIAIAHNHVMLISHEYPLDYNEAGMLVTTSTIAKGDNPFSLESQPSRISLYPVLYNILVAPLSVVLGNTLELHRAIVALFVIACCVLCFYLCRRESVGRTESFVAAALCYAALLFYSTPIASTNSLGLFFFLLAITVPWVHGFSTRSLAVTILLGILAFYTKQYFVACLGYVSLYMFLADSKKRAIYFGLTAAAAFIVVLALVCYISPFYLEDTFFAVQSSAKLAASNEFVITQTMEYIQIYLPLLMILAVAIVNRFVSKTPVSLRHSQNSQKSKFVNLIEIDKPLLVHKPNYVWFCCVCSVIIVVFVLGRNRGNHLTYFFQLISPFFLVGVFSLISGMPKWRWPFQILIVLALYNSYFMLPRDFSVKEDSWLRIRKEISEADDVYASTLVLKEIMEKGAPVYINGATRYFVFGNDKPSFLAKADETNSVPEIWARYVKMIQTKIKKREFDLLVIDNWMQLPNAKQDSEIDTATLLEEHYKLTDNITLPLMKRLGGGVFRVQIWKPITATADTDEQQ